MDKSLIAASKLVPHGLKWSVGTGTKLSHAQILADGIGGRKDSFFAKATDEATALRLAARDARDWIKERDARLARYGT